MAEHSEPGPTIVERWAELSPVRLALYPAVLALVLLLVGYGVIAAERAPLWLALAASVLGVAGTEGARKIAYSPNTVAAIRSRWADHAASEYARGVADAVHSTPDRLAAGARQCGEVRGARRCVSAAGHEGGHLIPSD